MKLKIGTLEIGGKTIRKWALLLLVQGVLIGLMIAVKQDRHAVSPALFILINVILIPALALYLFKNDSSQHAEGQNIKK